MLESKTKLYYSINEVSEIDSSSLKFIISPMFFLSLIILKEVGDHLVGEIIKDNLQNLLRNLIE